MKRPDPSPECIRNFQDCLMGLREINPWPSLDESFRQLQSAIFEKEYGILQRKVDNHELGHDVRETLVPSLYLLNRSPNRKEMSRDTLFWMVDHDMTFFKNYLIERKYCRHINGSWEFYATVVLPTMAEVLREYVEAYIVWSTKENRTRSQLAHLVNIIDKMNTFNDPSDGIPPATHQDIRGEIFTMCQQLIDCTEPFIEMTLGGEMVSSLKEPLEKIMKENEGVKM